MILSVFQSSTLIPTKHLQALDKRVQYYLSTSFKFSAQLYQWNSAQISTAAIKQKLINRIERRKNKTQNTFETIQFS